MGLRVVAEVRSKHHDIDQFDILVYVDNVLILAHHLTKLFQLVRIAYDVAMEFHITINESIDEVMSVNHQQFTYIGIDFDLAKKTVGASEANRQKIVNALHILCPDKNPLRDALSLYGQIEFCATVNQAARYHYVDKFFRARSNCILDEPAHVWPSIKKSWVLWAKHVVAMPPRNMMQHPRSSIFLVTDASTIGMAGILYPSKGDHSPHIFARQWSEFERLLHINWLEAISLRDSLLAFRSFSSSKVFSGVCRQHDITVLHKASTLPFLRGFSHLASYQRMDRYTRCDSRTSLCRITQ